MNELCTCCSSNIPYYQGHHCHECYWRRGDCCWRQQDMYGISCEESICKLCGKPDKIYRMIKDGDEFLCRGCAPPWRIPYDEEQYLLEKYSWS